MIPYRVRGWVTGWTVLFYVLKHHSRRPKNAHPKAQGGGRSGIKASTKPLELMIPWPTDQPENET